MTSKATAHEKTVKTAIRKSDLSGSFVVGKYRFSPYMACEHGCVYCDGRAERYFVEGNFERDIIVRRNLPELLKTEVPKLREKGFIAMGSGITDAYQPLEAELGITRSCALVLEEFNSPITIMTKSALASRDIDVWSKIAEKSSVLFLVSLTFADDADRQIFEPGASTVEERIDTLIQFKKAGCRTGVLAMPLLPSISDTDENLHALFRKLVDAEVDFVMPAGLTLRPGRQKDFFVKTIKDSHPHLLDEYRHLYGENRESGMVISAYDRQLRKRCGGLNLKYDMPFLVPHYIYRDQLHAYDEINVLLAHMIELYDSRGIDTRPLKKSRVRLISWITERKREYNRRRSLSFRRFDWDVKEMVSSGDINAVVENDKLGDFISEIIIGRKLFDYRSLKLTDPKSSPDSFPEETT
ncbi:MAG: hypothetical protein HN368_05705 [Spirochaetales bacterium]|jgi:DNA repair photolyase|nr:hypothetical protein [Spirochaetales bacterium]